MKYELFNVHKQEDFKKYYPLIKSWWEEKKWIAILPDFLSSRGIIIKDEDKYICAGWLYSTDSSFGIINGIISNNESKPKLKKKCLEYMLCILQDYAKFLNIGAIYLAMETRSLKNILKKQNFIMTSDNISEFLKKI